MKKRIVVIIVVISIVLLIPFLLLAVSPLFQIFHRIQLKDNSQATGIPIQQEQKNVTTINVNITPRLTNYDDSPYESSPVIDWRQYNCDFTSCRFWLLSIENQDAYIAKDGCWYTHCKEIADISNDQSNVRMDEDGTMSFSDRKSVV